jgi:hypothetical protein
MPHGSAVTSQGARRLTDEEAMMTNPKSGPALGQPGAPGGWVERTPLARHPVGGPLVLGLLSGLLAVATASIGGALPGYMVGRSGVGLWLTVGGFVGGITVLATAAIMSSVNSCPSCVDALIVLPAVIPIYLIPFAIGYWWGRRARRRAVERIPTAS